MITKFKIFENIDESPKVGDYVIFESYGDMIIARIINIDNDFDINDEENNPFPYTVEWKADCVFNHKKSPESYGDSISPDAIIEWSSDKEELEEILQANKYNL